TWLAATHRTTGRCHHSTSHPIIDREVNHPPRAVLEPDLASPGRGEDFRHTRNLQRLPASIPPSATAHNQRTLPFDVIFSYQSPAPVTDLISSERYVMQVPELLGVGESNHHPPQRLLLMARPLITKKVLIRIRPQWREMALAPILCECPASVPSPRDYPHPVTLPPLTQLCTHLILATCGGVDLATYLRQSVLGMGQPDGDLIVVGPRTSLRRDWFQKTIEGVRLGETAQGPLTHLTLEECSNDAEDTWDDTLSLDTELASPTMLSFVSTLLTVPTFLALPHTITHLALLNIPYQVPLQRLPTICPLLVFLDLSYNDWLSRSSAKGDQILMSVAWHKLRHLQVLGLREFCVAFTLLTEINRGRWKDVRIIT
ncbi:hypothetical protein EDD17DRAFT_1673212, partial [Pisolithus thermaeus]